MVGVRSFSHLFYILFHYHISFLIILSPTLFGLSTLEIQHCPLSIYSNMDNQDRDFLRLMAMELDLTQLPSTSGPQSTQPLPPGTQPIPGTSAATAMVAAPQRFGPPSSPVPSEDTDSDATVVIHSDIHQDILSDATSPPVSPHPFSDSDTNDAPQGPGYPYFGQIPTGPTGQIPAGPVGQAVHPQPLGQNQTGQGFDLHLFGQNQNGQGLDPRLYGRNQTFRFNIGPDQHPVGLPISEIHVNIPRGNPRTNLTVQPSPHVSIILFINIV